jgi:hypothetical protein
LDSIFESLSGLVLIWRLTGSEASRTAVEHKERQVVLLVGLTFLLLAGYIVYEAVTKLTGGKPPESSLPRIGLAVASLTIMPWLALRKRDLGARLGSRALIADSKETFACAWLSAALLLGLGANYLWGLWQADPLAGLVIAAFLEREGFENLSGKAAGVRITTTSPTRVPVSLTTSQKNEVVLDYPPPDANCLLSMIDHCLKSRPITSTSWIAGKHPTPQ